jgi:hypothetical protein
MRRTAVFLFSCLAVGVALLAPSMSSAALTQCPPVDKDTGCQFLITVTNSGVTVPNDPSQSQYDGEDDTLVGIENDSSKPITSFPLSSAKNIYGFDGDGLCDPPSPPRAPGCVVLPEEREGKPPTVKPGTSCAVNAEETENDEAEPCGFEPPAGEPSGLTSFGEGVEGIGFGANGDVVSGYEGPGVWFSNIANGGTSGVVNFSPALAPGAHTYFALEEALFESSLTVGSPTTLSTTLSGGGQSGASITVVQGTPVTDAATLTGNGAASATGSVSYGIYSDAACSKLVTTAGSGAVSGPAAAASPAETGLAPGTYYWQASYGGDINNQAAASACGSEILTVLAPTTTSTVQSGGGVSGSSLTVPAGTSVSDQAHIAGSLASSASGVVTYALYKDSKCTVAAAAASSVSVVNGVAGPSAATKPKVGTYYWKASYSGGGLNAASESTCGSEILVVALKANLGLPSSNACLSRRKFVVHPRAPHGVKLVSVEIQINGVTVKRGALNKRKTTVSLIGLPKGTFKVALITKSSKGKLYEDIRTFHTCVPGKHKKKK